MEVLESSFVIPSEATPKHEIWLSNLDLLMGRNHTPTVYFYRPNGDPNFFCIEVLKASLAKALVPFYPLAGRLGVDRAGRAVVQCTGEGVLFVVARSRLTVDGFCDFAPSEEVRRLLVPTVESDNPPCVLVTFQVTFFQCGGVCLGAAVHHTVADGLAALHFVNSWSDIARGKETTIPPYLDRTLLRSRSPPTPLFDHVEYNQTPQAKPPTGKAPFDTAILKLSKDQLDSLKSRSGGATKKAPSTFKAVVAYVWRTACKARQLAGDLETRLYMAADARGRIKPPLPPGFLGNAIFRTSAAATVGEVLLNPLEFGADKINGATARLDDEFVRSVIDFLELKEDLRGLQKGRWVLPGTDLWVTSWLGLPLYEADFGWGRPVFVGRAALHLGGVFIMNDPGEYGGLVLAVALEPENMPRFRKVLYEDLEDLGGA